MSWLNGNGLIINIQFDPNLNNHFCHCEERSDAAISVNFLEIASLSLAMTKKFEFVSLKIKSPLCGLYSFVEVSPRALLS
jgi:hypothetical protein